MVASVKGAPGVTTLALGLASVWRGHRPVVVECDPSGGDLAARFGHPVEPGLASLAAAVWAGRPMDTLAPYCQRVRVGADVVFAPPGDGAEASANTLSAAGVGIIRHTARAGTVIADVGRLDRDGTSRVFASVADHVLLLVPPTLDGLSQVQARMEWLTERISGRLWVVRAGDGPYGAAEIRRDLGLEVLGDFPGSAWGAGVLAGRLFAPTWQRLPFARMIRDLADVLSAVQIGLDADPVPDPPVGDVVEDRERTEAPS